MEAAVFAHFQNTAHLSESSTINWKPPQVSVHLEQVCPLISSNICGLWRLHPLSGFRSWHHHRKKYTSCYKHHIISMKYSIHILLMFGTVIKKSVNANLYKAKYPPQYLYCRFWTGNSYWDAMFSFTSHPSFLPLYWVIYHSHPGILHLVQRDQAKTWTSFYIHTATKIISVIFSTALQPSQGKEAFG